MASSLGSRQVLSPQRRVSEITQRSWTGGLAKKSWPVELSKGEASSCQMGHWLLSSRGVRARRASQERVSFMEGRKREKQKAGSNPNGKDRNSFIILVH